MPWVRIRHGFGTSARFYNSELKIKLVIQKTLRGKYAVIVYELPRTYPRILKRLDTEKLAYEYAARVMKNAKWQ